MKKTNAEFGAQKRFQLGEQFADRYLTEAEVNVLKSILINAERAVARELKISRGTVSSHLQNIKCKFQCATICDLRRIVIETKLVNLLFENDTE